MTAAGSGRIAVVGFASMDYACITRPFCGPGATTEVVGRVSDPWPGPGGVYHFVRELRRSGHHTCPITWVGRDELSDSFVDSLARTGANTSAVGRRTERCPTTHLFYSDGQEPVVYFDQGGGTAELDETQRDVLSQARWLCVGVMPGHLVRPMLDLVPPSAFVLWTVKADPRETSTAEVRALVDRAQAITFSRAERDFLADRCGTSPESLAAGGRLLVESQGRDGAVWRLGERQADVRADPTTVRDSTGAGDTLAAAILHGFVARDCTNPSDLSEGDAQQLVDAAVGRATALLRDRSPTTTKEAP